MPSDCRSNLPTIPWNECPPSRGIDAQHPVEHAASTGDTITEAAIAADANSGKLTAETAAIEAATATNTSTSLLLATGSVSEAVAAVDGAAAGLILTVAVTEAAAASEQQVTGGAASSAGAMPDFG